MNEADSAEVADADETLYQYRVIHHDGAFVRHEVLEAIDAAACDFGHFGVRTVAPSGDCHVE